MDSLLNTLEPGCVPETGLLFDNFDIFRPGAPCPNCGVGKLDYNGLLELECPACMARFGGGSGCT